MSRTMKDSGIPWIGEIPEGWRQSRMKNYFHLHGRIGWNGLRSEEFEEQSYAYLVTGQDFCSKNIDWNKCYQINKERYDEDEYIQLVEGDILVTKDGTIGKIAVVSNLDKPACLNSGIFVVKQYDPKQFNPGYLYWLLVSPLLKTFNEFLNLGGTTIIHLYQNVFERMPIVAPPSSEQHLIAAFLDKKCSEIDSLIELQEQMIEELKTYKQSVITEAVTKGIRNEELGVRNYKDSGIEWIGDVPEEWEVCRIKNHIALNPSISIVIHPDTVVSYMPMECLRNGVIQERRASYKDVASYTPFQDNDIVMAKVTPCFENGNIAVAKNLSSGYGFGTSEIFVIRCKETANNQFVFYYLQSAYIKNLGVSSMTGTGGLKRVNPTLLNNGVLLLPPLAEQQAIADYLDDKCADIDSLIQIKQEKIDSLKEYKKSVISEYVTGKREV